MKRSVKSTHFLSLVQCLSLDISFFSFRNSVSVFLFLFLFLSLLWVDGCLWMHMDTVSLGLDFRDRLEWDQVFRLELMLGDGTRVVCFFLETWILFVLSLFYIGSPYQIHHLQVVSYVQFTIFLIVKAWFSGVSVGKASAHNVGPWFDPWDGKILWRRKWPIIPVPLLRKLHGWRSLVGYRLWNCKELDTTEPLHFTCDSHTDL